MRLALSQRVEQVTSYHETRDCLDQRWHDLLAGYGHFGMAVPNRAESVDEWCAQAGVEGIILTGGNDIAGQPGSRNVSAERDTTERLLLDYAARNSLPVLAVCRGLQFLNLELGGNLVSVEGHVAVEHRVSCVANKFAAIESAMVNSYHNYAISNEGLASELNPWAVSDDGFIEAASHQKNAWVGIMWHPERSVSVLDRLIFERLFGEAD
jgi:gamma-glutamyl-gamma-aminobutyrate hydrolase PuuD